MDENLISTVEELVDTVDTETTETVEIDFSESIGWVGGNNTLHYSLAGRDEDNQHPINAIIGLRDELDEIERLKTVYSDKFNIANYYEWDNVAYDETGYFVSLVPDTSKIKICDGSDIFGVSVSAAGFIGGQNETAQRDNSYGLIVTSGLVEVRCELDVEVGDCVVSSSRGYAKKTESSYGYKVLAKAIKNGVEYAVILLGVQADITEAIGEDLREINSRLNAAETNIVSAINVANEAYNKASEVDTSNQDISNKVNGALGTVDKITEDVENLSSQVANSTLISTQAKAIAVSAATSAESMRNEAIASANNTAAQIKDLTKTIEPLTTWIDPSTGNSGASYLVNYIDNGLATKAEIEDVEDDLEHATSAIQKNAKSLQSLIVSIDKYTVGEYSTAHGLTFKQAISILEDGLIYAPTELHTETYIYTNNVEKVAEWSITDKNETVVYYVEDIQKYWYYEDNTWKNSDTMPTYTRSFTPQFLYVWGKLNGTGPYRWITIDKNYQPTDEINTSSKAVYFTAVEPAVSGNFGYWYTNSDIITDKDGNTDTYEPYTLYKWEEGNWFAVATLKGNVNNRSISQVRQTSNEVALEVTNARGSAATLGARITNTESEVQTIAAWTKDAEGNQYNLATIKQTADDAGASVSLVVQEKDGEKVVNAASIVTAINEDGSSVGINADRITMTGTTTFLQPGDVGEGGSTVISGSRITTGEIDATKVKVTNLQASSILVTGTNNQTVDEALANTLVSSTIYYALSTSTKEPPPDDAWSEEPPERERKKYMWQKTVNVYGDNSSEERVVCIAGADGEGAIVVDITSSAGTIYVNSDIKTTLIAKAYQYNQDITDEFPDSAFLWEKYDMYGVKDTVWSYTGKTIAVSNLDIYKRAMFNCVLDVEQRIETEDIE